MTINQSGWRPEMTPERRDATSTFTGNRALMLEEPLLFEIGDTATTGATSTVLVPRRRPGPVLTKTVRKHRLDPASPGNRLGGLERNKEIGLPGLSNPKPFVHYTRLPPEYASTSAFSLGRAR